MSEVMEGVRDHSSRRPVRLLQSSNRLCIQALASDYTCTLVDVEDLLKWLRENRPDLLEMPVR